MWIEMPCFLGQQLFDHLNAHKKARSFRLKLFSKIEWCWGIRLKYLHNKSKETHRKIFKASLKKKTLKILFALSPSGSTCQFSRFWKVLFLTSREMDRFYQIESVLKNYAHRVFAFIKYYLEVLIPAVGLYHSWKMS